MPEKKSISRSLGEFFGHIIRGAKTQVDDSGQEVMRKEIKRTVEEEKRGENIILRRTTIDEVEVRADRTTDRQEPGSDGEGDSP